MQLDSTIKFVYKNRAKEDPGTRYC
uniref:Uncharacterized protein n=1 Tax=Arundo donax TaxID=35708 RepID=A0A0A8ZFQ7_ARUDO